MRVKTTTQASIGDIMCNVNKPWIPEDKCQCATARNALNKLGGEPANLPTLEGHLFFIGRDYEGPNKEALHVGSNNVPQQTMWDAAKAVESIRGQLPAKIRPTEVQWQRTSKKVLQPRRRDNKFCSTKDVYQLRKATKGLVCGPIDKNQHELWFACPCLYHKAWKATYAEGKGYEKVFAKKWDSKKRQSTRTVLQPTPPKKQGTQADVMKAWNHLYRSRGWNHMATFDKKGKLNVPYLLFKAKNITDKTIRAEKWMKARPIAPQTKHPMRKLFHLAGKAWSFIASMIQEGEFTIPHSGKVKEFLEEAEKKLQGGAIGYILKDIVGCFPNMPKDSIKTALSEKIQWIQSTTTSTGISVPRRKQMACSLKHFTSRNYTYIPFEELLDIMEFALDNTLMIGFDGQIWRQAEGIPMGDPHSPGMCIITCAAMEKKWMQTWSDEVKANFAAKRFMDDVLLFYRNDNTWQPNTLLSDVDSNCYTEPLTLEDGKEGTFLETSFQIYGDRIACWLKNDNIQGEPPKIWRYQHFDSHGSFVQKKALLLATMKKVDKMASGETPRKRSALQKLAEFTRLCYPRKLLWTACTTLGVETRNPTWFRVREEIPW